MQPFLNKYIQMRIETLFRWIALSCLLLSLCSCASVGTKFTTPPPDKLVLGGMTPEESVLLYGKPDSSFMSTTALGNFQTYKYTYSQANFATIGSRVLLLEFKEGKLNG